MPQGSEIHTVTHTHACLQKTTQNLVSGILVFVIWVSVYRNYDDVLWWHDELKTVMTNETHAINHIRSLRPDEKMSRSGEHDTDVCPLNESVANNSMWHRWLAGTLDLFVCTCRCLTYTHSILSALWLIGGAFETSVHRRKIPLHVVRVVSVASRRMQTTLLSSRLIGLRLLHKTAQLLEEEKKKLKLHSRSKVSERQVRFFCFCRTLNTFGVEFTRWTRSDLSVCLFQLLLEVKCCLTGLRSAEWV